MAERTRKLRLQEAPQFPNAFVLIAVGRRNTQMRAKERKRKSAKERKEVPKSAKARYRVKIANNQVWNDQVCQRAKNGALDPWSLDLRLGYPNFFAPNRSETLQHKGLGACGLKIGAPEKRRFNDHGSNAPFSAL